ncbi:MAG: T9SS type A sorting domain-containing protein [Cryomorphaceae bacterium]|nr:T9SS type A sorting domain-containing protein [Cryomorphaceae bacterium]
MAEVNAMQMLDTQGPISVVEKKQATIRVFPNPTREVIHVELGAEMNGTYQVFNSVGQLFQEGTATSAFQLRIPTSGEYLLRVQCNDGVFYERISVVR